MKLTKIIHKNVLPDGTFSDKKGAIVTTGTIRMGRGEGCGLKNCNCSPGYYVTILMPLKSRKVEGVKAEFESESEMNKFLEARTIDTLHLLTN
jgi:hypothetical protein